MRGGQAPGHAFFAALIASAALAMVPARLLTPWTNDLSALLWVVLRPPAHLLTTFRHWLRPAGEESSGKDLQLLIDDRDRLRALWHSEQLRAEELQQRLEQIERTARNNPVNAPVLPVLATVVGRGVGASERFLSLGAGARDGVCEGDPAVIGGDLLVGRVMGAPSEVSSWLAPILDASSGRLDVYISPADRPEARPGEGVKAQVRTNGRGALVGEVDGSGRVTEGDVVRLWDPTWKPAAQGMRIGVVRRVGRSDRSPLRTQVEVECAVDPLRLRQVTLKVEVAP
jgi:cell shape-determining protein MreC